MFAVIALFVFAITAAGCITIKTRQADNNQNNQATSSTTNTTANITRNVTKTTTAQATVKAVKAIPVSEPTLPTVIPTVIPEVMPPSPTSASPTPEPHDWSIPDADHHPSPEVIKMQPVITWHVMGGGDLMVGPNPTLNRSLYSEYTLGVNVEPQSACIYLKWYLDGCELPSQTNCPSNGMAESTATFYTSGMSLGYHTMVVVFEGDNNYLPTTLGGTFLVTDPLLVPVYGVGG